MKENKNENEKKKINEKSELLLSKRERSHKG